MRSSINKFRSSRVFLPFMLVLLAFLALAATACENDQASRADAVDFRDDNFARAQALHPEPAQQNFPLRELLVEYTNRQDLVNHPWYTYILGENGNATHYFVSTTMPLNACTFLSSSEDVRKSSNGDLIMTAPSLDGIFYGGSGASSACSGWIVKDAATNAMLIIYGDKLLVSDQPLLLDTQPVRIAIELPQVMTETTEDLVVP